jgi:hypothetical protein
VAEVLQPDQQVVRGGHVADYAHPTAALVGELGPLVNQMDARDLRSGNPVITKNCSSGSAVSFL